MSNVVSLDSKKPHISGIALCSACDHEWAVAAPAGTNVFECPECQRDFGLLKHPVEPDEKWQCNCGEMLFWLTQGGAMCRGCGIISIDWCK